MSINKKAKDYTRRGFLGIGLLAPFLSIAGLPPAKHDSDQDDEFTTMLTAKGTVVKVRKSALKKAKVVEKNMSNISLLSWLKLKG